MRGHGNPTSVLKMEMGRAMPRDRGHQAAESTSVMEQGLAGVGEPAGRLRPTRWEMGVVPSPSS